jgi:hypothetical protein
LVCCLDPEEGCTCEKDKVCGGVHFIDATCVQHARVNLSATVHEIGQKRTAEVKVEQKEVIL